ncbi:hypothetical protein HN873_004387 [Arachis hypogaea]
MRHIPGLNVTHKLLKELANSFDPFNNFMDTWYGVIKITLDKIMDVLGLNASGNCFQNKIIYKEITEEQKKAESFKGCSLSLLIKSLIDMSVDRLEN